jgi:hypothetical protein
VPDQPHIDRIPLARSIRYAARGLPEVPNQYGPGVLVPSEITLTYRSAPDSQLGRVHAYVAGRIWVDGKETPLLPGGLYGQHYFDGLDGWSEWLAEEARLHDPDAPAADRAALREQVVQALYDARRHGLGGMTEAEAVAHMADAVLAKLPAPTDRAAVLTEGAEAVFALDFDELRATTQFDSHRQAWELGTIDAAERLRRMADEAQQDGTQR